MKRSLTGIAEETVDRPVEEVWAFLADVRNLDQWVTGLTEPERTSNGEFGVGSTYKSKYTYGGRTSDVDYEVTEFHPPVKQTVRSTRGPFPFEGTITLEPVQGGTRVRNAITAGSDSGCTTLMFTLAPWILRKMMRRQLARELVKLKSVIEDQRRSG